MPTATQLAMINSDAKLYPPLADPDGVTTTLYPLRLRVFARTPYDHLFTELGTVAAGEQALLDGCDGIYVDTFGDYGVNRLRAITSVPVIGAGEASLAVAAARLVRFSLVTVWPPSMGYLYRERLASCAGGGACVQVHHLADEDELSRIGTDSAVNSRLKRGDEAVLSALVALSQRAVAQDDSAGVLLGCTCMSPIAERLEAEAGVPVVDPSRAGLAAAFEAVKATPPPGRGIHRAARDAPETRLGLATALTDAYLAHRGVDHETHGSCEVCVTAPA